MDVKIDFDFEAVYRTLELDGERDKSSFLFIAKLNQLLKVLHVSHGSPVFIFGLGAGGRALVRSGFFNSLLSGILDNDSCKWGSTYNGVSIFSPEVLGNNNDSVVLIASDWFNDIKQQLIEYGVKEDNIINIMPLYTAYQWLLDTSPIEYYISSCEGL